MAIEMKPVKCMCGDEVCSTYGLNVGTFYQGCGFTLKQAEEICKAVNEREPLLAALRELHETLNTMTSECMAVGSPSLSIVARAETAILAAEEFLK